MKINQLKTGVIMSYGTQVVHILTGLIYTPIMLRILGQSEYGLYQLVHSIVAYLSLLSLGFGASYMRFYSRYKVVEDQNGVAKLNGMFLTIFMVIALICVICGSVLVINVDHIFGSGLTTSEISKARILMAIMVLNMALSFINSVFNCNVTAHEKFFFQRTLEFLKALFNPFLTLPLLILGVGSVGMVMVTTSLTVTALIFNIAYCFKKLKVKFSFKKFDFSLLKEMWIFTSFIFINMIVDQLNWNIDNFLLGRMIGTTAVAIYGVAGQLNHLYMSLSSSISGVFVPRVNMMVAGENDNKEITGIFTKVGRIQFLILGLILSGYVIFGQEFIKIWAGNGYDDSYIIGLFLMIPVTIPIIQNIGIEIQRAKNKHKVRSVVYLLIAISNIFISIFCIKLWGAKGAAIGTAISLFVGNGLFMNWYYHKKIGINILYFWKEIAKFLPALCLAVIVGIVVKLFMPLDSIVFLASGILIYLIAYAISMWLFGMNETEKDLVRKPMKAVRNKLCRK